MRCMNTTPEAIEAIIALRTKRDHAVSALRQEKGAQKFFQVLSILFGVGTLVFMGYSLISGQGVSNDSMMLFGASVGVGLLFRGLSMKTIPAAAARLVSAERALRDAQITDPRWHRAKALLEMIRGSAALRDKELSSIETLGDAIAEQLIQRRVLSGADAVLLDAAIDERIVLMESIWQSSLRAGGVGERPAAETAARAVLARLQATAEVSTFR